MVHKLMQLSHLDAVLGANEARTESYFRYGERALEMATTQCAKSSSWVGSSADEQIDAVRKLP